MATRQELLKIVKELPDTPGVYFFMNKKGGKKDSKNILYIGKATSLCDRVRSYFSSDLMKTRGPMIAKMIDEIEDIQFENTDSVLEALILEAHYIKKYQPYYNSREKDNKSWNYVVVTDEEFSKVIISRGRELQFGEPAQIAKQFVAGPFPNGLQLREALKIIRRIFPFRDEKCVPYKDQLAKWQGKKRKDNEVFRPKACFNRQIGLCPGVCTGEIDKKEYRKIIRNIKLLFEGRKKQVLKNLEREMKRLAKERKFEEANIAKGQVFALTHIQDVSLLKRDMLSGLDEGGSIFRIEAYDIAHISGTSTVGVMVVVADGEKDTGSYRKFRIRGKEGRVGVDDTGNLREVLLRRLGHAEWPLPNLIVIDGSVAQINVANTVLKEKGFDIPVVSVVKDERHKQREIIGMKSDLERRKDSILLANSEAHRFAISYHRNLRGRLR